MRTTLSILFVSMLITQACEDKAGYHKILSRPTLPNKKGLNIGDTTLNYYDNSSKRYPFNKNQKHNNTNQ